MVDMIKNRIKKSLHKMKFQMYVPVCGRKQDRDYKVKGTEDHHFFYLNKDGSRSQDMIMPNIFISLATAGISTKLYNSQ